MNTNKERNKAYARLALAMLNLQDGQRLVVRAEPVHLDFLTAVSQEAYSMGAKHVDVRITSQRFLRARLENSKEEYLDYVPSEFLQSHMEPVKEHTAFLSIHAMENPSELVGVDTARYARVGVAMGEARKPYARAIMQSQVPWLVIAAPTAGWAKQIIGSDDTEKLWEILGQILLLDNPNPVEDWRKKCEILEMRAKALNSFGVHALHFTNKNSDFTVGLSPQAIWRGGRDVSQQGQQFLPNLPTEEVFTAPDRGNVNGKVAASRDFVLMGQVIKGARFEFKEGRVVDYSSETGHDVLESFFSMDDANHYLGEIALVDNSSPIAQCNKLFFNTLIDENSGVHFAFGSAYETTIKNGEQLSEKEKREIGFNISRYHEDITFGTPDMTIEAQLSDGSTRSIMKDGKFTI